MAESYYAVLTAAISDMVEHGFDSAERLAHWQRRLREAAEAAMPGVEAMDELLQRSLRGVYKRYVEQEAVLANHRGVPRWAYDRIKPRLRSELDKRIMASLDLIRLHREESMARQARRFAGWATSIPAGGAPAPDRRRLKADIRKPLARLPFEERRVMIDQSAKLVSAINSVVAQDGGAVAATWRHVHQRGYDARPDHLARDGKVFLVRGSWADEQGLVRGDPDEDHAYTDELEQPAELPYCRCSYTYLYQLRQLPERMLTARGREKLAAARALVGGLT